PGCSQNLRYLYGYSSVSRSLEVDLRLRMGNLRGTDWLELTALLHRQLNTSSPRRYHATLTLYWIRPVPNAPPPLFQSRGPFWNLPSPHRTSAMSFRQWSIAHPTPWRAPGQDIHPLRSHASGDKISSAWRSAEPPSRSRNADWPYRCS